MPYLRCTAVCSARVSGKPHSLAMLAIDAEEPDSFLQASSNRRSVRNSLNVLPVALRNGRQKCSLPYPNSRATSVASRCCLRCDVMYPMICMVMFLPDLTNSGRRTPETNLEYSSDSNSYSSVLSLNPRMASSDCPIHCSQSNLCGMSSHTNFVHKTKRVCVRAETIRTHTRFILNYCDEISCGSALRPGPG